jgi:hypothetical protein
MRFLFNDMTEKIFTGPEKMSCTSHLYLNHNSIHFFCTSKQGNRLPKPKFCPKSMYAIQQECWSENPILRPTFANINERIKCIIDTSQETQNHIYVNINDNLNEFHIFTHCIFFNLFLEN